MPYSDMDEEECSAVRSALWYIVIVVITAIAFWLCSCTYADKDRVVFLGGKGAYKSKQFALTTDNEKSFNDATLVAAIAIPAAQAVATAKSANQLSAIEHTNNTKLGIVNSNNHTKEILGAQSSALETTKATTLPK